jgi:type I restriction enzyme S subunit
MGVAHPGAANYQLAEGELVFARTGASVGKSYLYNPKDGELVYAGFLINIAPDLKRLDPKYLALYAQTKEYWDWIARTSVRSGQPGVNGREFAALEVPVRDIETQRAIVEAVDDAESLIGLLERMVVKKQAIKQGMMQRLLTGRTRLPGFCSTWKSKRFADLVDGLEAGVSVRSAAEGVNGDAVLKTSSVDRGAFIPSEAKPILLADVQRARCNPTAGCLIISRMNTPLLVGEVGYVEETRLDLFLPDRLWLVRPKRSAGINMRWLAYYLAGEPAASRLRGLATGTSGSMKNIPKGRLLVLDIDVPGEVEQNAIAAVLANIDEELAVLHARLAKARAIKTGMVQQLLTGRTRLPVLEAAA